MSGAPSVRRVLGTLGVRATKSLGQHFLADPAVADRQVGYAEPNPEDVVLEVGPGLGILTERLRRVARRVVCIEKDPRLASHVAQLGGNVQVIPGDATRIDWLPFDIFVSNLPYNISSPVVFRLLDARYRTAVVMVQAEFAERMVSGPGGRDYGRLSVGVAISASARILERVPASAFVPPPKVDSAIVRLAPRSPDFSIADRDRYRKVVQASFAHRRKTLANGLAAEAATLGLTPVQLRGRLSTTTFGDRRAETLSPREFSLLTGALFPPKS